MKKIQLNQRIKDLKPSPIRAFNDRISGIEGLIRLTLGEPDFDTPDFIKEAMITAMKEQGNGYTHSKGLLELRRAIRDFMQRKYDLNYDPETEIIVTHGATEAIFATLTGILNPGDKVLAPSPNYAVYATQVGIAGGEFIPIDVSENEFILTPEQLSESLTEHPETKVLLFNHPSNPTGRSYSEEQLEALADIIRQHDILVMSDEIYAELTYTDRHISLAKFVPDQTIVINGASKSHAMTGWRMGFICGPDWILTEIFKAHQSCVNTPTTQAQYAAIAAYNDGDQAIELMRKEYKKRRDFLVEAFEDLGYQLATPQGAFYLFIQVPDWFKGDDYDFCLALAKEAKVGLIPGQAFGSAGYRYFRLSYAASMENLQTALERIKAFTSANQ